MEGRLFNRKFSADSEQLKQMRNWVREASQASGLAASKVDGVVISVNEACMNIIEHAYQKNPGEIVIDIFKEDGSLVFILTDFAPTVDCSKIRPRKLDDVRPGGLGVHFIREIMDEVEYLPGNDGTGNVIRMKIGII